MKSTRKKSILSALAAFILIIGTISYLLADRYLIEHVEIENAAAIPAVSTLTATAQKFTGVTAAAATAVPQKTAAPSSAVTSDAWNYKSEAVSISIKKVVTGSGANTITYYVADAVVADATQLSNAFAKNKFGRNIIETTSQIAQNNNAIFAINGDYYGFRTDGIIIRNGVIYRDQPARTGLAFYKDGTMKVYDETTTSAQALLQAGVWNTLSFGPVLIQNSLVSTTFKNVNIDNNLGNHTIEGANPRTGVGIIDKNHFVFVVVDGRSPGYSKGATLAEFAAIFKSLGCTDAYNIDGGGSSTMYFMGKVVNNPLGDNKERGTSDILFIG